MDQGHEITTALLDLNNIRSLLKCDGVKNLLPQMKEEEAICVKGFNLSGTHGITNLFPLKEENAAALDAISRRTLYAHVYMLRI
jgi:hypothetical protein